MSGFAAIVRFDGGPVDASAIRRMTAAMDFRAQDGMRHAEGAGFALGHCAFHTTPGAADAPQPLFSADGLVAVVMDGWLANHEELLADLTARGARLRNHSDAELILHAYDRWGDACAAHMEGEYGLVIWDGRRQRVLCLRDHLGMRAMHYHWDGRRLLVASDVAAILAVRDFTVRQNAGRMAENLASQFHARDETVWDGVMRLPVGSLMLVDQAGPRVTEYWSLLLDLSIRYRNERDYYEHYRELLMDCVRRAARSCAPVGCEVSGGHDSSAIFALACRLKEAGNLPAPDVAGFTLAGLPGTISDEIGYARDVGQFLHAPIHEVARTCPDLDWFERNIAVDRDMPFFPNAMSIMEETRLVRARGCRVLLDGEGGDEFAGGSGYVLHEMLKEGRIAPLMREMAAMARERGMGFAARRMFRYGLRPFAPLGLDAALRRLRGNREVLPDCLRAGPHWAARPVLDLLAERREAFRREDRVWKIRNPSKRRLWRELRDPEYDAVRDMNARMMARLGIEMRTAMYSRRYFEFISAVPETMLVRGGYGKHIHLQALRHDLPATVLERRSKAEFSFTFRHYLDALRPLFLKEIPESSPEEICPEGLRNLFDSHLATGEGMWEIWRIFGWFRLRAQQGK